MRSEAAFALFILGGSSLGLGALADTTRGLPGPYNPLIPANSWAAAIFSEKRAFLPAHHAQARLFDVLLRQFLV
jgi:hypothetical protein